MLYEFRVFREARGSRSSPVPKVGLDIPTAMSAGEQERLAELASDQLVLEVGAQHGASTVVMAKRARRVHSVDWHRGDFDAGEGDTLMFYWRNLLRHGVRDRVVTHVADSADVLPALTVEYFDGVLVDSCHDEGAVRRDIELVRPLVKPGGWLAFHDYGRFGVTAAVDELAATLGTTPEVTDSLAVLRTPTMGPDHPTSLSGTAR